MTNLFDRIRQRRSQDAPPDEPQAVPAGDAAAEAPTAVHAAADAPTEATGSAPTAAGDVTGFQPAIGATGATADAPTGDAAPTSGTTGPRTLADEAALAAELPDDPPSRAKPPRQAPGLTPLIPTGDPTPTEPTQVATPDATGAPAAGDASTGPAPAPPTAPAVPQPPVLGPPTSGGTPPAAPPTPPTPAPVAAAEPAEVPKVTIRSRGRMRRRLRYLRRVRELGYRDLGGLVFELRRANASNPVLVDAKVDALRRIDAELHALEHGLRDYRSVEELHEPGVSVCIRCGALHGSDANYCPHCGVSVTTPVATVGAAAPPPATVDGGTPVEPAPTPAAAAAAEPADARPRAATPPPASPGGGDASSTGTTAAAGPTTPTSSPSGEPTAVLEDGSPSASDAAADGPPNER